MSATANTYWQRHKIFETSSIWLLLGIIAVIAIGGLVEIVPLFYLKNTIERVEGVRPYSPLELAGFNIYVREGCYTCHSQMIRPLRDEVERYGHYSLAAESMYDHPFQWGSKRNGPDLARVGGKYSDDWHRDHMRDPRAVVPSSIMPGYAFLETTPLDASMIDNAVVDLKAQGSPNSPNVEALQKRYPAAIVRDLGAGGEINELDALVAYLQRLGTQVDFKLYDDKANIR
jgi:cytochrome c oxidase cbb3-type subunit 2